MTGHRDDVQEDLVRLVLWVSLEDLTLLSQQLAIDHDGSGCSGKRGSRSYALRDVQPSAILYAFEIPMLLTPPCTSQYIKPTGNPGRLTGTISGNRTNIQALMVFASGIAWSVRLLCIIAQSSNNHSFRFSINPISLNCAA
jgi:hypothetical protein